MNWFWIDLIAPCGCEWNDFVTLLLTSLLQCIGQHVLQVTATTAVYLLALFPETLPPEKRSWNQLKASNLEVDSVDFINFVFRQRSCIPSLINWSLSESIASDCIYSSLDVEPRPEWTSIRWRLDFDDFDPNRSCMPPKAPKWNPKRSRRSYLVVDNQSWSNQKSFISGHLLFNEVVLFPGIPCPFCGGPKHWDSRMHRAVLKGFGFLYTWI